MVNYEWRMPDEFVSPDNLLRMIAESRGEDVD